MIRQTRLQALRCVLRDESAQVLPWMVLLVALFLGFAGLTIDLGHAYVCKAELQASTDAAALAGGTALAAPNATTATVTAAARAYSSYATGANATPVLPSVTFPAPKFECLNTLIKQNILCAGSATNYNAIQVTQTATITTFFIQALNVFKAQPMTSMTLTATSTAAMKGAGSQYNVALLIDTTGSMGGGDGDGNCSGTRIVCAQQGAQILLQSLTPCTISGGSSCTGYDNVSVFTYPNVDYSSVSNDYTCTTGKHGTTQGTPTIDPYSTPSATATSYAPTSGATYQVVGFSHDYSSNNSSGGALSTSSDLSIAVGASGLSGCPGMQAKGGEGTYFAGAVYAALSALYAEQTSNPGSLNALVILSDGDANAQCTSSNQQIANCLTMNTTGTYPSPINQCQQAITAAQSASSTTTVYTVAYGASTGGYKTSQDGCDSDRSGTLAGISPCTTLQKMATSAQDFYADKGTSCSSTNGALDLGAIFSTIGASLQNARLIPNNTT